MAYNFEFAVSAQISAKVAEDMIRKIVEEQTNKKVARIEMKTRSVTKGIGPSESTETVFDGVTVYFVNENSSVATSNERTFKPNTYA